MKKIILTAAIVLGMASANAQEIKFGAKAGLNIASVANTEEVNKLTEDAETPLFGFHVGGFAEAKFGKFAVQPELLFSTQGQKYKGETPILKKEVVIQNKTSYINIPVMLKYYVVDNLALEVGPQFGFLVSAKNRSTYDGKDANLSTFLSPFSKKLSDDAQKEADKKIKENTSVTDIAMNFGASFNVTEQISIGARYSLGLTDTTHKDIRNGDDKTTNNVIQVSLGFSF